MRNSHLLWLSALMFILILVLVGKSFGSQNYRLRKSWYPYACDSMYVLQTTNGDSVASWWIAENGGDSAGAWLQNDTTFGVDTIISVDETKGHQFFVTPYFFGEAQWPTFLFDFWPQTQASAGSGTNDLYVYVWDSVGVDSTAVPDAVVEVKNVALSSTLWATRTDGSGLMHYAFTVDTVAVRAAKTFYDFPETWDTIALGGDDTLSIVGGINYPSAAPGVDYVCVYIDIGSGVVDSATGTMIPRDNLRARLSLVGSNRLNDGSWAIAPKTQVKPTNDSGRVYFHVPANSALSPSGSYYELYYQAHDRYSSSGGPVYKFYVDTLTDPIKILDCEEVH